MASTRQQLRAHTLDAIRALVGALARSARSVERRTGVTTAQLFVLRQLAESDTLFSFIESKIGRYKVSDRILFQDVDDAETYNDYIERIQKLAAKEARATVENQKAALSKLAAMERELLDGQ